MRKSWKTEPYRDFGNAYKPANVGDKDKSLRKNPGNMLSWQSNKDSIAWWKWWTISNATIISMSRRKVAKNWPSDLPS